MTELLLPCQGYRNMLKAGLRFHAEEYSDPEKAFFKRLEVLYQNDKESLRRCESENTLEEERQSTQFGLFLAASGLFVYGRLDVVDDILDNIPSKNNVHPYRLAFTPNALLPLPADIDPVGDRNGFHAWLAANRHRLIWSEALGRYINTEEDDDELIGWPECMSGSIDGEPVGRSRLKKPLAPLTEPIRRGRVIIDNEGIEQKPQLLFFGQPFKLKWSEISSWASRETRLKSRETGEEKLAYRTLELYHHGGLHVIIRTGDDFRFLDIVSYVKAFIPDKQTEPVQTT